ncbi:patatin-like phospholipase family protein [Deferribacteraceae bacterium V6Fe1]|nr:patatin-like phospholipase family protein [Deferribacteraceae bacterium V6Fe1]
MKLGLALGGGAARGWAHIGVIRELEAHGIIPDIICGTSIGALVGGSYAANNLDKLENVVCSLTKINIIKYIGLNIHKSGIINMSRLEEFLKENVADESISIEDLSKTYGAVATDIRNGKEVILTKGSLLKAICASISFPGLFPPTNHKDKWLIDGGLVNPIPISLCRYLGADIVIAVNLNEYIISKSILDSDLEIYTDNNFLNKMAAFFENVTNHIYIQNNGDKSPSLFETVENAVNITQNTIAKCNMVAYPPNILLSPKLTNIGLLDFHYATQAIEGGRRITKSKINEIKKVCSKWQIN